MVVRRDDDFLLKDTLKRMSKLSFKPSSRIIVQFVGEQGKDTSGLTREFFMLFGRCFSSKYLTPSGCFIHNSMDLQEGVFFRFGQLSAMALIQSGGAMNFLGPSTYNFMCGMKPADVIVSEDDITDYDVKLILQKIQEADNVECLRQVAFENMDLLSQCGYTRPVQNLALSDKVDLVQTISLQQVVLNSLGELSEFRRGLDTLGVARAMEQYPHLLRQFFCIQSKEQLTSDKVRKLFEDIKFSERGSNAYTKETATFMMFVDFLEECEKAESDGDAGEVTLGMVLNFFTGSDAIPPCGYGNPPELNFSADNVMPTASTCAPSLTLPTKYSDYEDFKSNIVKGMTWHGGFGLY